MHHHIVVDANLGDCGVAFVVARVDGGVERRRHRRGIDAVRQVHGLRVGLAAGEQVAGIVPQIHDLGDLVEVLLGQSRQVDRGRGVAVQVRTDERSHVPRHVVDLLQAEFHQLQPLVDDFDVADELLRLGQLVLEVREAGRIL